LWYYDWNRRCTRPDSTSVSQNARARGAPEAPPTAGPGSASAWARVCIVRRMPRMQVYLPDELYAAVKERKLPASELLQEAVEAELRRQRLNEQADAYLAELVAEVGEPSPRERARADAIARRIRDRAVVRQVG
jgi:post-segregation antitoxin (ccd killing protein)